MLVLSRKLNEEIVIGGKIVVKVVEIRGDRVRLGIQAPPATTVHRAEIHEAIRAATVGDSNPTVNSPIDAVTSIAPVRPEPTTAQPPVS